MLQPDPGPILLQSDIERAISQMLSDWVPYYLAEVDEQQGLDRGTTEKPRFYDAASDNERRWLEETPPAVLIICPGTTRKPERHGDRACYGAWWQVNIGVTAAGATEQGSRILADRLGGAIMAAMVQQGDMGGLVERTEWLGRRTEMNRQRPVMTCEIAAECYIRNVVDTRGPQIPTTLPSTPTGPADPLPQPDSTRVVVTPILDLET